MKELKSQGVKVVPLTKPFFAVVHKKAGKYIAKYNDRYYLAGVNPGKGRPVRIKQFVGGPDTLERARVFEKQQLATTSKSFSYYLLLLRPDRHVNCLQIRNNERRIYDD